jgi:hypothetical protein
VIRSQDGARIEFGNSLTDARHKIIAGENVVDDVEDQAQQTHVPVRKCRQRFVDPELGSFLRIAESLRNKLNNLIRLAKYIGKFKNGGYPVFRWDIEISA